MKGGSGQNGTEAFGEGETVLCHSSPGKVEYNNIGGLKNQQICLSVDSGVYGNLAWHN